MNKIKAISKVMTLPLLTALFIGTRILIPDVAAADPPHVRYSGHVSVNHNYYPKPPPPPHHHPKPPPPPPPPHHYPSHHHNTGAFVAGTIAGLAVGAIVRAAALPPSCNHIVINNMSYRQCGASWYQPYYVGTELRYMVVAPPR